MSDDGIVEIALGTLFTIGGLTTLFVPDIPVICWGAIVFGPIILVTGLVKQAGAGRRPSPGPYRGMPPPVYARYRAPGPTSPPPMARPPMGTPPRSPAGCAKCGTTFPPNARFCTKCGTPVPGT